MCYWDSNNYDIPKDQIDLVDEIEFTEETGYTDEDINLINNLKPLDTISLDGGFLIITRVK